ncbi:MAG: hypothetical protein AB8B47_08390 [Roseobacter sp.]
MSRKTEIATTACTLGCALGIGFVMQSGEVAEMRYGSGQLSAMTTTPLVGEPAVPVLVTDLSSAMKVDRLDVRRITLTSAKVQIQNKRRDFDEMVISASADSNTTTSLRPRLEPEIGNSPDCTVTAEAQANAAAMIGLSINAPCFASQAVTIHHEGLNFSQMMSDLGTLDIMLPALTADARVSTTFANGDTITASTNVDSVPLYDRVVVQWQGETGVQIHAREFGADYGDEGHVWSGASRDFSAVAGGRGGFLTSLGDKKLTAPLMAEVYTFPTALSKTEGAVELTVETEVTEANCGTEVRARAIEFSGGTEMSSQILNLAVPNCGAIGNFLVLNNLLQDLTVASK